MTLQSLSCQSAELNTEPNTNRLMVTCLVNAAAFLILLEPVDGFNYFKSFWCISFCPNKQINRLNLNRLKFDWFLLRHCGVRGINKFLFLRQKTTKQSQFQILSEIEYLMSLPGYQYLYQFHFYRFASFKCLNPGPGVDQKHKCISTKESKCSLEGNNRHESTDYNCDE